MTEKPQDLAGKPAAEVEGSARESRLRDGLRCLQISGAFFLRAHFTADWAYQSPPSEQIVQMLRPGGRRVILFHIFTEGRCRLALDSSGGAVEIAAGDVAILPFADGHRVGDPALEHAVPITELLPPPPWAELPVVRYGGGGVRTSMVCGYFLCDDLPFNPVLGSLPPFIRVRPSGGPLAQWVNASVEYALHAAERQRAQDDPLLQRLPELLFTECLCDFASRQAESERGWLAGLSDPVVGRALACMHRSPAHPWTLQELARHAGSSRSVLDERFRALLGQAPMGYLSAWRLQLAARQLRTSGASMAEIAGAIGYGSEASFSRAFKRHAGISPSEWRARGSDGPTALIA